MRSIRATERNRGSQPYRENRHLFDPPQRIPRRVVLVVGLRRESARPSQAVEDRNQANPSLAEPGAPARTCRSAAARASRGGLFGRRMRRALSGAKGAAQGGCDVDCAAMRRLGGAYGEWAPPIPIDVMRSRCRSAAARTGRVSSCACAGRASPCRGHASPGPCCPLFAPRPRLRRRRHARRPAAAVSSHLPSAAA